MKILFVSSGNKFKGDDPVVNIQGESLEANGMDISYFLIEGHGVSGYLRSVFDLKKRAKENNFDLIHAHFSYSGYVAWLACNIPIVVSLLGSDVYHGGLRSKILRFFVKHVWTETIVKSERMKERLGFHKAHVIPNGVNLNLLREVDRSEAIAKTKFDSAKKHVIFVAVSPESPIKNLELAEGGINILKAPGIEFHVISKATRDEITNYMNAADVLLLTSLTEGSPNVIKEALACNLPVVSTDVGDVSDRIEGVEGCYITSFNAEDVAEKLELAIKFDKRTNGREKVEELEINRIAKRIIEIYKREHRRK